MNPYVSPATILVLLVFMKKMEIPLINVFHAILIALEYTIVYNNLVIAKKGIMMIRLQRFAQNATLVAKHVPALTKMAALHAI